MTELTSEQNLLSVLRSIFPIRGLLHVGAGGGAWIETYKKWDVPSLALIEADSERLPRLREAIGNRFAWSVHGVLVAGVCEERIFHTANNRNESGLVAPEDLAAVWRNLATMGQSRRPAQTIASFLDTPDFTSVSSNANWLVVDCLPALEILRGAGVRAGNWDVVVGRALVDLNAADDRHDLSKAALDELMKTHDFSFVGVLPERNPVLGHVVYACNWKARQEYQRAERARERQTLEMRAAASQSSRDEAVRRAGDLERHVRDLEASEPELRAVRDEAVRRAGDLERRVRDLEASESELRVERDEAVRQVATREAEHARLAKVHERELTGSNALFNRRAIMQLRNIDTRAKGQRIYLEVKSLPRSGLHYMRNTLEQILGSAFSFCEWYNEPGCCRKIPCGLTGILEHSSGIHVRMVKSHDFHLSDPAYCPQSPIKRLVLVRDPLFILTSWWALDILQMNADLLEKHGINVVKINYLHERPVLKEAYAVIEQHADLPSEATLSEWLEAKSIYILNFVLKWCDPAVSLGALVPYDKVSEMIVRLLDPLRSLMDDEARHRFELFSTDRRSSFLPRQDAFSGPTEKISACLRDHAALFERVAGEIVRADETGYLGILAL